MTARRHWTDFPEYVSETVQRLHTAPRVLFGPCSKADAYRWRNELNRFRRAVLHEFHENKNTELAQLMEPLRAMTISVWEDGTHMGKPAWYVQVKRAAPPPEAQLEDLTKCLPTQ